MSSAFVVDTTTLPRAKVGGVDDPAVRWAGAFAAYARSRYFGEPTCPGSIPAGRFALAKRTQAAGRAGARRPRRKFWLPAQESVNRKGRSRH